jgi:hypothetical protein
LRYEVPVDDQWHRIDHLQDVVHVDCRDADVVEFWATDPVAVSAIKRHWEYRVFGTGQPDVEGSYVGTALSPSGLLVWHLFRREV